MRRLRRPLALLAAAAALLAAVGLLALYRFDPVPQFSARQGQVLRVTRDSATIEEGHRVEAVTVFSTSGIAVPMLIKRPLHDAPAPLVLVLGGHTTGREAARLIPDTEGRAVVALSYPYDGPHRLKGLELLRWVPPIRQALFDTPPAIHLALDWLLTEPWVDGREVHGVGASLGTPFMIVAAALDPRITAVWSVHGAGRSRELLAHNARAEVPSPLAPPVAALADLLVAGHRLSPEHWVARISPRPFTMLNATEDERLPRGAVTALYEAAESPKELVWMPGPHVLRSRPEVVRQLVSMVLGRMGPVARPPAADATD